MKRTVCILLGLALLLSLCGCNSNTPSTTLTTQPSNGLISPTGPLYQRASYTVSDSDAVAARDVPVLSVGDHSVSNGFFQFSYWSDYFTFLDAYGSYASTLGLDLTLALDQQTMSGSTVTWQQRFVGETVNSLHKDIAMMLEAEAIQLALPDEMLEELDGLEAALLTAAQENGFDTALEYIQSRHGMGTTVDDFCQYMRMTYIASYYYSVTFDAIQITEQMLQDFYTENQANLNQSGITKDGTYVHSLRHILIAAKEDATDADWDQCRQTAQQLLDEWLAGEQTEATFAQLATDHSQDEGSVANGGKYTGLTENSGFAQPFKDWYLSEDRTAGDYALIQTEFGYHVMYYVGIQETWQHYCSQALLTQLSNQIATDAMAKHPLTVDYSKIMLGVAPTALLS